MGAETPCSARFSQFRRGSWRATSIVIIEEGHVGIVKRRGRAVAQLDPGFRLKLAIADRIEEIEVRQRLIAPQAVNGAEANAHAKRIEAEAEAIRLVNEQLERSPRYIELARAKRWNGVLPATMVGTNVTPLLSLK